MSKLPPAIGFSARAGGEKPLEWAYELEEMGYSAIELVQEGTQKITAENIDRVQQIKDTTNLTFTIHLPFSDINLATLNPGIHKEIIRQMGHCLHMASGLAEIAVIHPGYLSPEGALYPEKAWDNTIKSLKEISTIAGEEGIMLALENMPDMPHIFGKYPAEILEIIEKVDSDNIGMTLDIGHANTMGLLDEFLDSCREVMVHSHIHDNHEKRDEHLPLGKGCIDWKKVFDRADGYEGLFITEMKNLENGTECMEYLKSNLIL
ncbi:sugar phosphate isomerase/epimerase family protein [Methanohalophilus profundi]|uniref:sugar phosphate isomerase/epimerase family protein n=1 Tax=Methanohalophilus profundi TaxID=2138083 RepID=UPI002989A5C4|nr:sugar phosphate isomerase/epimerase family protein [Methanohalophilus profundi]